MKLITDFGELDLTSASFSTQENNSRTSDQQSTKLMLPFDVLITQDFIDKFGDYASHESVDLKNEIPCFLVLENKFHEAKLFIQSVEGFTLTAQVDYGFEEIPNFSKKLSELNLENFDVDDIYSFAKGICAKPYPLTNFQFPRIYTTKYSPDQELWKNFDGYINDLKRDGSEMRRNYIEEDGSVFNVNIIHPCPHALYLLKQGFADAGYNLEGDILSDPKLINKWVYSNTEYFSRFTQKRKGLQIFSYDYDGLKAGIAHFIKPLIVEKAGSYKIVGFFNTRDIKGSPAYITLNGIEIWKSNVNTFDAQTLNFNLDFTTTSPNSELKFFLTAVDTDDVRTVIQVDLIGDELIDEDNTGEDNGVITNPNKIDLRRAVPEMTFGEYVNVFKNWFNYDIEITGRSVVMNMIANDNQSEIKDFQSMEISNPKINFLNKKSFKIKFTELDEGYSKDSMYYDINGALINGKEKADTSIIEINGYHMPLILPKIGGYRTAVVAKDSDAVVALVEYSGLQSGQNNAIFTRGLEFPELLDTDWKDYLRKRINGKEYNWSTFANIEWFSNFSIKNFIYCYKNIHIIKTISKDKVSKDIYRVEFTTETVN